MNRVESNKSLSTFAKKPNNNHYINKNNLNADTSPSHYTGRKIVTNMISPIFDDEEEEQQNFK